VKLGAIATLITTGGLIAGGIWMSILWMINPTAVAWINRFLPEWTQIPVTVPSPPQTLAAIQDGVRQSGLIPGEPIPLKDANLLLPLLTSRSNCQTNCEKIVELRVYQPVEPSISEKSYRLVSQLSIAEPEEYFVLSGTKSGNTGVSRTMPLTQLSQLSENAPEDGIWFNLSGQRLTGDTSLTYGQVIHYNPDQTHLSIMLQWTTPQQLGPYWQQVTGSSTPELVLNQTVGLEPQFKVYQIKPRKFVPDPIYLEEISLTQPALNTPAMRQALMLARSGLWSPALQLLQSQKPKNWSATAQAQMDVIQLHAQVTASQAQQSWVTPSQQIFADLIDGRWGDGLVVFRTTDVGPPLQEIASLLKTDSGGLWQRVEAALKVKPQDSDVRAWGALMLSAQQGRPKAIAWLKQLDKTHPTSTKPKNNIPINQLLDHLDAAFRSTPLTRSPGSPIIGTAQQVTEVNPQDWLPLGEELAGTGQKSSPSLIKELTGRSALPLQLEPQQVWYQVQVTAFNDGQRWQQMPFANLKPKTASDQPLGKYLDLDPNSQLQITVWTGDGSQESTIATVKGVSFQGGIIQLLAAGEPIGAANSTFDAVKHSHPLAYTIGALNWLEPGPITLSDLNQLHPQWVSAILPALWRELSMSGRLKAGAKTSVAAILGEIGQESVRIVELTGDDQPELVLTLYEDPSGARKKPIGELPLKDSQFYQPRSLIFSNQGALLYSEFSLDAGTSLIAIADLGDSGPAALILDSKNNYRLRRWSPQRQQFE